MKTEQCPPSLVAILAWLRSSWPKNGQTCDMTLSLFYTFFGFMEPSRAKSILAGKTQLEVTK